VLINSVILVLREVLEAAMLASVLLALSRNLRLPMQWLLWSAPLTIVFIILFAATLDRVTDAFDGAGQELASAGLQGTVFLGIVGVVLFAEFCRGGLRGLRPGMSWLMGVTVTCAMIREGSEILIYITGFAASEEHRTAVFAGSTVGAGIGVSLGVLLFAALRAMRQGLSYILCIVLLAMIGAGMVMQSTMLLEQVDWLPVGRELWDSSALVSEQSITGQLLYAVFGYEATPGLIQGLLYAGSIALVAVTWAGARYFVRDYHAS
jgi:high-affinity iron transporter